VNARCLDRVFSASSRFAALIAIGGLLGCSTAANAPRDSNVGEAGHGGDPVSASSGTGGAPAAHAGASSGGAASSGGSLAAGAPNLDGPDGSTGGNEAASAGSNGAAGAGGAAPATITGPVYYLGVTVDPGACLDVVGAGNADGTELQEWSCNAGPAQGFILDDVGNGAVRIVDSAAQKCVAPAGGSNDKGSKLVLAPCDGSDRQKYTFKASAAARYSIVHDASGKCFDVPNASVAAGTRIQLWDCNQSAAQLWTRARVGTGYTASCGIAELEGERVLAASCKNNDSNLVSPALDLNACLSNSNGKLTWASEGGFAASCESCALSNGASLSCKCKNIAGASVDTNIDLSAAINNCNGELTCGACGSGAPSSAGGKHALTALYGSDGNDFYRFSGASSIANLKNSGWNTLFLFAMTVQANGDISAGGSMLVQGGKYVGDANWAANVDALKSPPTSVHRYEVTLGGWGDASYDAIKSLIAAQGTGSGSTLFKNFQALKKAVPGIDAVNDDDEQTYDLASSTAFGKMLNGLGLKLTQAPYMNPGFWVQLKNNLGDGCDVVYLQCYQGGAGNDPGTWDAAYGSGFHVVPGEESNDHAKARWGSWASANQISGGFYWPDVTWAPGANWGVFEITNGLGLPP